MAAAKIERTYTIPLRREFRKVAGWKKTKKAVRAVKEFLQKHMKSDNVKLSTTLNEKLWKHGIKNPPHHIKVSVSKDENGVVNAELFGVKKEKKVAPKAKATTPAKKETEEKVQAKATAESSETKKDSEESKEEKSSE